MSYLTFEVLIENGRVISTGADILPVNGKGLLVVQEPTGQAVPERGLISRFIEEWQGAFSPPSQEETGTDPKLAYLVAKHLK